MKIVDRLVLIGFVAALVILCFFQNCTLDIYFLAFGFAVAAICGVAMLRQHRKLKQMQKEADDEL